MSTPNLSAIAVGLLTKERERYGAVLTALAGITDTVPDAYKPFFTEARTKLNAVLAGLPPLEQVAGANEANSVLDYCGYTIRRQDELMGNLNDMLGKLGAALSGSMPKTALAGEIKTALDAALAKGEVLTKENHLAILGTTKTQVEAEFTAKIQKRADRRAKIATAGVLAPTDESRLDGEDAAFDTALATAKTRVGEIRTAIGLAGEAQIPAAFTGLIWAEQAVYAGQIDLVKSAVAANGSTGNPERRGDPTQTGGGNTSEPKLIL